VSKADQYIRDCDDAADLLDAQCQPTLAYSIRGLIRSYKASRIVNGQLHKLVADRRAGEPPIALPLTIAELEANPPPPEPVPLTPQLRARTSRLLEPVAAGPGGLTWCDQCQARVSPHEGRSCTRMFCGMKPAELAA
jgi:hypothetical protein